MVSSLSRDRLHLLEHPMVGLFTSPVTGFRADRHDSVWASDNDCFSGRFDPVRFERFLRRCNPSRCVFVTAPDVVGDPAETMRRYEQWAPRIRCLGYPVAFALQDGQDPETVPDADAIFVGGSTGLKYSQLAAGIVRKARERGQWVHWGRVNTRRRIRYVAEVGCDSFDGTSANMWPDTLGDIIRWTEEAARQRPLF